MAGEEIKNKKEIRVLVDREKDGGIEIERIVRTTKALYVVYRREWEAVREIAVFDDHRHFGEEIKGFKGDLEAALDTHSNKNKYRWHSEAIDVLKDLEEESIKESLEDFVVVRVYTSNTYNYEEYLVSEQLLLNKLKDIIYTKLKEKIGRLIEEEEVREVVEEKFNENMKHESVGKTEVFLGNVEVWTVRDTIEYILDAIEEKKKNK